MHRCILALLLINVYGRGFGLPVDNAASNGIPLADLMSKLEMGCENNFLKDKIKDAAQNCKLTIPPYAEKQYQCLMFFDISMQLCSAVASKKLILKDDYPVIDKEVKVSDLCTISKGWNSSDIAQTSQYKKSLDAVFKKTTACTKVCEVDDVLSEDSHYYCKFYKWGMEMLSTQTSASSNIFSASESGARPAETSSLINTSQVATAEATSGDAAQNTKIEISQDDTNQISSKAIINESSIKKIEDALKEATTAKPNVEHSSIAKVSGPEQTQNAEVIHPLDDPNKTDSSNNLQENTSNEVTVEKIPVNLPDPIRVTENEDKITSNIKPKEEVPSKPNETVNLGDYGNESFDSDELKESLPDQVQDDVEDPNLVDLDTKPEPEPSKAESNNIDTPVAFNVNSAQRESILPSIQEGFTDDDDDHFFSFFLTAVILVMLLYILYHNKSKVSKVVLGLIVEGRQGRRRNSRGHAYRKLDTLEQAMNTKMAAPPSKIIY